MDNRILNAIKKRTVVNPIRSKDLEAFTGLRGSEIRDTVRELRQNGELIGSISRKDEGEGGYFYISSRKEFEDTVQHLQHRADSLLHTIRAMNETADKMFDKNMELF